MAHNDWQQVEELFHATFELPAEEQAAYLARACAGDAPLRAEVETLLTAFERHESFMEQGAFSLGLRVLSADAPDAMDAMDASLVGKRFGAYEIAALLGRGGMGAVYLATDTRLGRRVALKFLADKLVSHAWGKRQLMKEAQAAARLDHPNICAVHGFEEAGGHSFIVMQYVEGQTLASLLAGEPLALARVPGLARQIASALAEAHAHGIIHRDIKSQNIMVTAAGQAKVLDFGLAKFVERQQSALGALGALANGESENGSSQLGLVVGTVAYMSPEQLRAERLDFRTDIFSFGVVLYEMIAGRNPYIRASKAEMISAILASEPPPAPATAGDLSWVAQKCLRRERDERYQSASEVLLDLEHLSNGVAVRPRRSPLASRRVHLALALLLLLVVVSAFAYARLTRARTLAVLPIVNESADAGADYLGDGLTDVLVSRLSRLSRLHVKPTTQVSVYKGYQLNLQQVGRDLKVETVFTGTIAQQGGELLLKVRLVATSDGTPLWEETFPLKPSEMLAMQEELPNHIVARLRLSLSAEERKLLAAQQTSNPEAFRNYLLGRHYWNKRDDKNLETAIGFFEQAIKLDPLYAQAYAGQADCYVLQSSVAYRPRPTNETMALARSAAKKALEIDNTLCEAHTSLGVVRLKYDWDFAEAERELKRALGLNPDYAPAHYWHSNVLALTGRLAESIAASEKARELDPFSPLSEVSLGRAFYYARRYDQAAVYFIRLLEKDPRDQRALYLLSLVYLQTEKVTEAIEMLERLHAINPVFASAPLGCAYGRTGRLAEARQILSQMEATTNPRPALSQEKAIILLGLGDQDQAFALLQKSCEERYASFPFVKVDPLFDGLRADTRFADLVRCAKLTP